MTFRTCGACAANAWGQHLVVAFLVATATGQVVKLVVVGGDVVFPEGLTMASLIGVILRLKDWNRESQRGLHRRVASGYLRRSKALL